MSDDDLIRREGVFMSAVWDALKADTTDLGKQQRILHAFRAANAECADVSSAEIAIVREEVKNRFGVGEGKMTVIAEPAAPTFTAADLERAWEMGRDMSAKACDWGDIYGDNAVSVIRALITPADLAQRVKE